VGHPLGGLLRLAAGAVGTALIGRGLDPEGLGDGGFEQVIEIALVHGNFPCFGAA
jgi:hypothetical protein